MKLRIRSIESKQTLKFDVPDSCTLSQLKQTLAQSFPNSSSPNLVRLSLNRKDDLQSDGGDTLHSLGIAAGDLIYFSLDQPSAPATSNSLPDSVRLSLNRKDDLQSDVGDSLHSLGTAAGDLIYSSPEPSAPATSNSQNTLPMVTASPSSNTQLALPDAQKPDFTLKGESSASDSQMEEAVDEMEVDDEDNTEIVDRSFSVPGFLRKVFMAELGVDDAGKDNKLIAIAVHAVMLESGFVGFDKNTNAVVSGFQFGNEWPSSLFRVSLFYTLKEKANKGSVVMLKFQSLGKFINVYGTLENGSGNKGTYRAQLNKDQLVPFLNVVWANCGLIESIGEENGSLLGTTPEKEVFKFWRSVKDNLALPLLIDICEELGLGLPPCFMRLPTDLKLKILESLTGVEIAKASCVCSELRYLGSSEDLWKVKFGEEFGEEGKTATQGSWKKAFVKDWGLRRRSRVFNRGGRAASNLLGPYGFRPRRERYPIWPRRERNPIWPRRERYLNPFMVPRPQVPRIIGDDYEVPIINLSEV